MCVMVIIVLNQESLGGCNRIQALNFPVKLVLARRMPCGKNIAGSDQINAAFIWIDKVFPPGRIIFERKSNILGAVLFLPDCAQIGCS
jgi:hypothetical protein